MSKGTIVQIIGAVVDVEFPRDDVPRVYHALIVEEGGVVLEVQQQLTSRGTLGQRRLEALLHASWELARVDDGLVVAARARLPIEVVNGGGWPLWVCGLPAA